MLYVMCTDAKGDLVFSLTIQNDGTGTPEVGNYTCKLGRGFYNLGEEPRTRVVGHERSKGAGVLVAQALDQLTGAGF